MRTAPLRWAAQAGRVRRRAANTQRTTRLQRQADAELVDHVLFRREVEVHLRPRCQAADAALDRNATNLNSARPKHHVQAHAAHLGHVLAHDFVAPLHAPRLRKQLRLNLQTEHSCLWHRRRVCDGPLGLKAEPQEGDTDLLRQRFHLRRRAGAWAQSRPPAQLLPKARTW